MSITTAPWKIERLDQIGLVRSGKLIQNQCLLEQELVNRNLHNAIGTNYLVDFGILSVMVDASNDPAFLRGVNVLEVAGYCFPESDDIWPARAGYLISGANYLGTDIIAPSEVVAPFYDGQKVETKKVDTYQLDQEMPGEVFDIIVCHSFFGAPSKLSAYYRHLSQSSFDRTVMNQFGRHLTHGGLIILSAWEDSDVLLPSYLEKNGYDYRSFTDWRHSYHIIYKP